MTGEDLPPDENASPLADAYLIMRRDKAREVAASVGRYHAVRYVSMNDAFKAERDAWCWATFPSCETIEFSEGATHFISNAYAHFETIMLGGNDTRRIARILKTEKLPFARKPKIALVTGASPTRRAQLLKAGFDDIFDTRRMAGEEAIARLEALRRRYDLALGQSDAAARDVLTLSRLCGANALTKKERILLLELAASPGRAVRYTTLVRRLTEYHENISRDYLKVVVCSAWKKIVSGARIVSVKGYGYVLCDKHGSNLS